MITWTFEKIYRLLYVKDKEVSFKIYRDFYVRFTGICRQYVNEVTCRFAGCSKKIYKDFYTKLVNICLKNLSEIACT